MNKNDTVQIRNRIVTLFESNKSFTVMLNDGTKFDALFMITNNMNFNSGIINGHIICMLNGGKTRMVYYDQIADIV